jgi:putative nucleotidyltransferase with HDIG domain
MKAKIALENSRKQAFTKPLREISILDIDREGLIISPSESTADFDFTGLNRQTSKDKGLNKVQKPQEVALENHSFFDSNLLCLIGSTEDSENTVGHSQRVAKYTLLLAREMGIEDEKFLTDIEKGAVLHDIGKIGIPKSILSKNGALSVPEMEIIKGHPFIGYEMIEEFDSLRKAALVVLFHHERFDGNGYPYGLNGQDIPLGARIFAVADTLDAITSDRPYRIMNSFKAAYKEIGKQRGRQFDPQIADVFLSTPKKKWHQIRSETENSLHFVRIH